ncbi:hypothetical protein CHS0354_039522 [Potamilus streckersoni]|uniref:Folliculin n=1 Tax=Potamilus streckersoni TaxID=2493646 RepID=A0AAE0WHA4_9BIVA|nr:hypothetical protein CHS0354_039522 [Potamilus streckersoni]
MNAIISLCHFCELHGPKILYCTQPLHPQERTTEAEDVQGEPSNNQSRRVKTPTGSSLPSSEPHTPQTPTGPSSLPNYNKNDHCEGCTSIHFGFVSHDEDAHVSYFSSQRPHHRDVFSMIRQACIRSLSCEVCPGREGPIFFGEEQDGYVISYTFYIKDNQARGLQRWYSIIVVMMDKIYLLNSWPFLVPHLRTVIDHLQTKALKVYQEEQSKGPHRPNLGSSITPSNFMQLRSRAGNKPARSLVELTSDKNIFKILHSAFVWILKACGNRISETLLEGPPTEDSIIDMEKQEETEEGFVKLFSKKLDVEKEVEIEDAEEVTAVMTTEIAQENEVPDTPEIGPVFTSIRHLMKVLGAKQFHVLAHHTIIGNQIIVRGAERGLVRSVLNVLKDLVPKGCCRMIPYSKTYEESWRCNFLGLAPDVSIRSHANAHDIFLMMDIIQSPSQEEYPPSLDILANYKFKFSTPEVLPEKGPSVLSKMELALHNENLSDEVVKHCIICLKEEWMNKVKVLFKFTKAGGSRSEEDAKKLLLVVGAQEADKQLLKFWITGLSVQYRHHILTSSKSQQSPS